MRRAEPIDWTDARRSLAELDAALQNVLSPSTERTRELLEERAVALAQATPVVSGTKSDSEAVVFSLAGQRLALETRYAREVIRSPDVTPVPGAGRLFVGIANLRGELLPVFDLREFFGIRQDEGSALDWTIICGEDKADFGILVDAVEIIPMAWDDILDVPTTVGGTGAACLRGVTRAGVTVLDTPAFIAHPSLFPKPVQGQSRSTGLEV